MNEIPSESDFLIPMQVKERERETLTIANFQLVSNPISLQKEFWWEMRKKYLHGQLANEGAVVGWVTCWED